MLESPNLNPGNLNHLGLGVVLNINNFTKHQLRQDYSVTGGSRRNKNTL